jgi:hypothetical protein
MQDCEFLQESHMNLIQELPSKYKDGAEQQMDMPCVKTMAAAPQYGAVQPPLNIE